MKKGLPAIILACAAVINLYGSGRSEAKGRSGAEPLPVGAAVYPLVIEDDSGQMPGRENRTLVLERPVQRIVVGEVGCALALQRLGVVGKVVGASEWIVGGLDGYEDVPSIGGVNVDVELVIRLEPDVFVNLVGHNDRSDRQLIEAGIDVYTVGTVRDLDHVKEHVREYGLMFDRLEEAEAVVAEMEAKEREAQAVVKSGGGDSLEKPTVFMFGPIGDKTTLQTWAPAGGTIVEDLIVRAGGRCLTAEQGLRGWPQYSLEKLLESDPEIIILPLGEYEFSSVEEFTDLDLVQNLRAVRNGRVYGIEKELIWDLSFKNATALLHFARFISE
jgi:iron complex transport system substrate-binding protein